MNGASKILTVSYGTFSCTLEGFDDPFNTMKAIAEYFRGLAAEDRYFGAEPPQPDAAMLHKIAEREIQRRVESKIQENGVILRAGSDRTPPQLAAERSAQAAPEVTEPRPVVHMPAARAREPAPRPAPSLSDTETGTVSVAERLSQLRRSATAAKDAPVVASMVDLKLRTPTPAMPAADPATDALMDTPVIAPLAEDITAEVARDAPHAEDTRTPSGDAVTTAADAAFDIDLPEGDDEDLLSLAALDGADAAQIASPTSPASLTSVMVDAPLVRTAPVTPAPTAPVLDDDFDDDDTDAMLAALSAASPAATAVISASPDRASTMAAMDDTALLASLGHLIDPEEDDFHEEGRASIEVIADTMEADDSLTNIAAFEADTVIVAQPPSPAMAVLADDDYDLADDTTEDGIALGQDDVAADDTPADSPAKAGAKDQPASFYDEDDAVAAPMAEQPQPMAAGPVRPVRPARAARIEATPTESVPEARPEAAPELQQPSASEPVSQDPVTIDKLQRARARVIKIRRNDATVGDATPAATPPSVTQPRSILTDEAEAALAAELAALESDTPKPQPGDARAKAAPAGPESVDRLMSEASSQMQGPDTRRRQSAIAHLKAAVAATLAERRATGNTLAGDGKVRLDAYRNDLAAVVRPHANGTEVAKADRPAPLVLVSEQRIDRPAARPTPAPLSAPAAVQPVRPRRPGNAAASPAIAIATQTYDEAYDDAETAAPLAAQADDRSDVAENIFGASDGFADFADRLGANGLPALLEAAAAYIACVEGRDSFTRPQLMRHIGSVETDMVREDGLRSFGILLRDGVIEKTRRGQFALTDRSAMLAEARKIAG